MKSSLKLLALLAGILLTLRPAQAQNFDYWNGGTGFYTSGSQWTLGTPPAPTDYAVFDSTSSVTLPTTGTSVAAVDVLEANVSLTASATSFTTGNLYVYDSATLNLYIPASGTFTVTGDGNFVGDGGFGTGTLNLSGNGTLAFTSGSDPIYVGGGGFGVVNQTGGTATFTGALTIGSDSDEFSVDTTGTGVYNLSGTSTLTASQIVLGVGTSGATVTSTGSLTISSGTVGAGYVALGVSFSGTGTIDGDTGVIAQSGGTFTATTLDVGENSGGIGNYSLSGNGVLSSTTTNIGDKAGASGTFTQSGGSGTFTTLNVGENGRGSYSISSGSLTILDTGSMIIGDQTDSSGTFNQTGGDVATVNSGSITVGNNGAGTYNLSSGTLTIGAAGSLNIGTGSGTGTFTLSGGELDATGTVNIGAVGGAGAGVFNDNGGTLDYSSKIYVYTGTFNQNTNLDLSAQAGNPIALYAGATYNLNSGTLTIGGDMTTSGFSGIFALSSATFNFAGGTVQPSGTDWYDALNGSVTGNSTIDTTNNNAIISGALTGSGTLTVTGANTVQIDTLIGGPSSSSASWSANVESGTLSALASTFPAYGNITIGSSATVDMATDGTGTNILHGAVSGAGAFTATFTNTTDTLDLAGPVGLTGATDLLGGGTLEVATGTLGSVTGDGSFVVGGSGTGSVNLTGAPTYTGSTTINSGYTLTASGISSTALVTNNGALGVNGTPGSVFNIGGGLVSTGTLLIRMTGVSTDEFALAGTGTLSGSVELLTPGGTGTFTIVHTTASGDLIDNGVTLTNNTGRLFQASLTDVNNQNLELITTTSTIASLPGIQLNPNQAAVANSIDALINNNAGLSPQQQLNLSRVLLAIAPTGVSNAQLALNVEELSPESLQYAQDIAFEHSTFLASRVDGFDDALHHEFSGFDDSAINITLPGFDSGLGRQMQSMLAFDPPAFHQTAPNGVNYYPGSDYTPASSSDDSPSSPGPSSQTISDSPQPMPMRTEPGTVTLRKPDSNFSAFVGGDGAVADLNQSQGATYAPASKASYTSAGAIAGVSYRMTSNLAAGVLFDYDHTDATTDSYGSKTKVDTYSPGVFATYGDKGFYINGLFAYGYNSYSNSRVVPVFSSTANSDPDGSQYTGALDAGYDLHPAANWTITPAGGLTYTHLDVDSFTETGANPVDLSVNAQHDDSLRSRLGGYLSYQTQAGALTLLPNFSAFWQHEFLDESDPITSQLGELGGSPFTIQSVSMGRDSALIGLGLTAELNNSMAVFVNCMLDINSNYNAEDFIGGVKGSF